eukprot:78772-Pleurochrysis_carterae.AAC.3
MQNEHTPEAEVYQADALYPESSNALRSTGHNINTHYSTVHVFNRLGSFHQLRSSYLLVKGELLRGAAPHTERKMGWPLLPVLPLWCSKRVARVFAKRPRAPSLENVLNEAYTADAGARRRRYQRHSTARTRCPTHGAARRRAGPASRARRGIGDQAHLPTYLRRRARRSGSHQLV